MNYNKLKIAEIINLMEKRNIRGLARAISIIENNEEGAEELLNHAFKKNCQSAVSLGFTGAPGAGKSTLVNAIIKEYRQAGKFVGVIAVDPTSPYSGGAVLGDRIRMQHHNVDSGVYIRSLASRRAQGGLSDVTKFVLYLYRAFGFDVIIVETLGVGQDEIDVAKYVDVTSVLLVPGYGDNIQLSKAGIMEIADVFIINKSDKSGADTLKEQLKNIIYVMPEEIRPPIVNTIADQNVGIAEAIEAIEMVSRRNIRKARQMFRQRIAEEIRSSIHSRFKNDVERHIEEMVEKVLESAMTPIEASQEILKRLLV
jgi:LAO/AO transport system kinase